MIKTSYYSKYKGANGVSIAVGTPKWFKGETYPKLFPTWDILNEYKKTGDEEKYIKAYVDEVLSKLDPQEVYDELKGKMLLCWESSEKFCHRHIVAKWLKDNLNIEVEEIL